jgi:D-alanine-D-alanine ligase-like ATP-grasp enzyme
MAPNVGLLFPHTPGLESTSSTINPELAAQVRRRVTPALVNTYAVSELGPISGPPLAATTPHVTASLLPADASDIGQPLAGVVVQILDAAGQPLPAGQTGQIAVRFADDSLDVRYLDPSGDWVSGLHGGWFLPGDLGRMSADGRLAFFGRADDLIIFNGINIYPSEIEQAARLCAGVRDACAFGVPSQMHQQIPFVAIIPEPGFVSDAFLREIGERLGNRMPRRCLTVPEFPRNAMGKLLRRALIEQVTAEILRSPRASSLSIGPLNHGSPSQPPALPRRFAGDQKFEVKLPLTRPMPATVADWAAPLLGKPDWGPPPQLPPALVALQDSASQRLAVFEQLSRLLLTLARVPLFTPLTINSCRLKWAGTATPADTSDGKEGGTPQWQITWRVPIEPFLPRAVYIGALKGALKMIAWIERTAPTPDVIATVYAQIERKLVMPLKALVPAGASTIPVLAVAHELGIPYFHLGMGVYQLGWGARARRLDRSMVEADSALGSKLAQSKHVTANLLHMAGLPAPVHKVVLNSDQAKDAARELGYPLVVKPADLDRGEGVTVDIDGEVALLSAFEAARALSRSKQVIVERQVPGLCHRLFVQDGRLLYAVQRGPMSVCGDGRSSVRALIEQGLAEDAWRPPWQRSDLKPLDALAEAELARNGLSADSVPAVGQAVALRRIESTGWGGVDVEVTTIVHPDNLAVALAAAKLFSLNVAGIDIITPDITVPWHANGAIVNEVNSAPLLGGAEISRSHLPAFLDRLMGGGDGRIPLLAVADLVSAQREKTALAQSGLRAWITSAAQTHDPDGQPLPMVVRGLHARVQALLCRADVEALIINADSR